MTSTPLRYLPWAGLLVVLGGYAWVCALYFTPACTETDTAGYFLLGERLARGGPLAVEQEDPFRFHSHVWVETPDGGVVPKYTPGYPLLLALGYRLAGERGAFAVSPVCGALTLVAAFLLFRLWAGAPLALGGALLLAANPMVASYTNYPLAHAANLCFVTWGMFFLFLWLRGTAPAASEPPSPAEPPPAPTPTWRSALAGIGAGLCLGFAVLVRPAGALLLLAVLAAVGSAWWRRRGGRWPVAATAALLLAYAVFPVVHMLYNHALFGSPFVTGYDLTTEQSAFSLENFWEHLHVALNGLGGDGLGFLFGLGLLGLFFFRRRDEALLAHLWFWPTFLLYAGYYWAALQMGPAYSRFFLSLFPLLVGTSLLLLRGLPVGGWRRAALAIGVVVFAVAGRWVETERMLDHLGSSYQGRMQAVAADIAAAHLPEKATLLAEPYLAWHVSRGKDFRVYNLKVFDERYAREAFGRQYHGVRRQQARTEFFQTFYREHRGELDELLARLVREHLDRGRPVAFLVSRRRVRGLERLLGEGLTLEPLAEWNLRHEVRVRFGETERGAEPPSPSHGLYRVRRAGPPASPEG